MQTQCTVQSLAETDEPRRNILPRELGRLEGVGYIGALTPCGGNG